VKLRPASLKTVTLLSLTLLGACRHAGELTNENGGGDYAVRSACPIAGVPAATGDINLFNPAGSSDSRAIDVTASITDVRATCQDAGEDVISTTTFTIVALRRDAGPARQVVLPYFNVALRGGSTVIAKQIGQAVLNFEPGNIHAWTRLRATIRVNRGAVALSAKARAALTRVRKAGDLEAAVDPLSDPEVQKAVADATVEQLIGFQLTQDQIKYNTTR